ncbi:hypothetical protein [Mangrovicella endophytica]|uniref:hypothetical protein n=1 Tax=Mangrovicella endophytica TaxID=2066697 RepID=UPI001FDF63B0|nr:hypothetical protein [Mangrovicella endophytica]
MRSTADFDEGWKAHDPEADHALKRRLHAQRHKAEDGAGEAGSDATSPTLLGRGSASRLTQAVGAEVTGAEATGAAALGAGALGALAIGALAIGAVAVGAFAIGRLSIGRARVRDAAIGRLRIGQLEIGNLVYPAQRGGDRR